MPTRSLSSRVKTPSTRTASTESGARVASTESGSRKPKAAEPAPERKSGWVASTESGARVASTETGRSGK